MKSKYKETDSSNLTTSEKEEWYKGSFKTVHENKNDLEQFWIFNAAYKDGKRLTEKELLELEEIKKRFYQGNEYVTTNMKAILSLPKYNSTYGSGGVDCWGEMEEDKDGEYIKLEDILNLFSAKNS